MERPAPLTPWGPVTLDPEPDGVPGRILEAAMARFSAQGIAATTMSQLAADVGISRMWLYRWFENRDAVVRGLLGREASRFVLELTAALDPTADPVEELLAAVDRSIEHLRGHPLVQRVLVTEPEVLAPYLASGTGPLLRVGVDFAARYLRDRLALPAADAEAVAEALLRLFLSIVVNNDVAADFDDPVARRAWLRAVVPRLIGPRPG